MANIQIPNLPAVISLAGPEMLEVVQDGVSRRATTGQIANMTVQYATAAAAEAEASATQAASSASSASTSASGASISALSASNLANNASTSATSASQSADTAINASYAAIAAGASVGAYPSTAIGLSSTTNGQRFWAPIGEYLQLYLNNAGTAVIQTGVITPLKSYFDARFADGSDPWALKTDDNFLPVRLNTIKYLQSFGGFMVGSDAIIEQPSNTLRLGSLYVQASAANGLQFVSEDGFILMTSSSMTTTISME